jgi:hypothetical protein
VLPRPATIAGAGELVLHLTESGALTEIPVPIGSPRRLAGRARRPQAGGRRGPRTDRGEAACGTPVAARLQRLEGGVPVRDLEDDRRQEDRRARGPGAVADRQERAPEGIPVEVGPALRGTPEAGRRRGASRFRGLIRRGMATPAQAADNRIPDQHNHSRFWKPNGRAPSPGILREAGGSRVPRREDIGGRAEPALRRPARQSSSVRAGA